jgi:hypothetical protein
MKARVIPRLLALALACIPGICADVKTKVYTDPEGCFRTYRLAPGRVLTSRGLIEDPTVNAIVKEALSAQMNSLNIAEAEQGADVEFRFMGGSGAGLQVDAPSAVGDAMMWDIGGPQGVPGRTYKKSTLVIGVFDKRSNKTVWTATCTDKFGDPSKMRERIDKAIEKAFSKFPKTFACR